MSEGERHDAAALPFGAAFALILIAAASLAFALISDGNDAGAPLIALVASGGGLFLLWIGVVRRSLPRRSGA